jgi:hypothetical protein
MHQSGDIKDGGIRSVIFAGSATLFLIVISFGITVFIQFHDVSILKHRVRILEETCLPPGSSRTSHHRSPVSHSFKNYLTLDRAQLRTRVLLKQGSDFERT